MTTLMPMGARSRAMGRVIPTMPPLEAEYAAWPTWGKTQTVETHAKRTRALIFVWFQVTCPSNAATLAVLMMHPL